jgi:hypothetical protein
VQLTLSPADLAPLVQAAVDAVIARRAELGDRLAYPEQEAARLLGIKPYVLRDARRRGEISGRRVGRSFVYTQRSLLAWLEKT